MSDTELARTDIASELGRVLAEHAEGAGSALPGDLAVAAAITLGRLGTLPRSLTFLAEIVRSGGISYAAELSEPLPTQEKGPRHRTRRDLREVCPQRTVTRKVTS
ncbi:hypothetical protein [Crossiella sp. CA198]|uniref:hypothetical protein n=1 Tax=Crossiella sp. CA198 TaxID=3455607 RepID=UPI003F8D2569